MRIRDDGATTFRVWAPNASSVSVISDRNGWEPGVSELDRRSVGCLARPFDGFHVGDRYKYWITSANGVHRVAKSDPFARCHRDAARDRLGDLDVGPRVGRRRLDGRASRAATATTPRSPPTRCTSGRGATSRAGTPRWAASSPTTASTWASPTSSCCRSWSIRSTDRGATRAPATSRRRPGTARPTIC